MKHTGATAGTSSELFFLDEQVLFTSSATGHPSPSLFISHLLPLQCIVAEEEDDDEEEIRFSPGGKEKAAALARSLSLSLLFAYSPHARVAKAQLPSLGPSEKVAVVCLSSSSSFPPRLNRQDGKSALQIQTI